MSDKPSKLVAMIAVAYDVNELVDYRKEYYTTGERTSEFYKDKPTEESLEKPSITDIIDFIMRVYLQDDIMESPIIWVDEDGEPVVAGE